jgi:hypothetical protein
LQVRVVLIAQGREDEGVAEVILHQEVGRHGLIVDDDPLTGGDVSRRHGLRASRGGSGEEEECGGGDGRSACARARSGPHDHLPVPLSRWYGDGVAVLRPMYDVRPNATRA